MKTLSCMLEIQHRFHSLTPVEKKIAQYIMDHSDEVIQMSVDQLAEKSGTVKSAVVRCSKALGFKGFQDLKLSLATDVAKNQDRDYSNTIEHGEDPDSIINKIFAANIKTLQDTKQFLNVDTLSKIAYIISQSNMVYIYGVGTSAVLSIDFQHRLFQVGYPAMALTDITSMRDSTLCIQKGDVAFAFCDSGRTIATIETMKLAKSKGAVTACLTGYTDSPITAVCDYSLFTTSDEFKYPIESITSRVARIAVIDALIVTLSTINYSNSLEKMLQTRKMINEIRYPNTKGSSTSKEK